VYARDPATGICCFYSDPCRAPQGWPRFNSEAECNGT
jgi:hypothetical protein